RVLFRSFLNADSLAPLLFLPLGPVVGRGFFLPLGGDKSGFPVLAPARLPCSRSPCCCPAGPRRLVPASALDVVPLLPARRRVCLLGLAPLVLVSGSAGRGGCGCCWARGARG